MTDRKIDAADAVADGEMLDEQLILAWVRLTAVIKNGRITSGLAYNEAIVMLFLYDEYKRTGSGVLPFSRIVSDTRMLKSLANRTVTALEEKGFVERQYCDDDKRAVNVAIVPDRMEEYLNVHGQSLELARAIISVIGQADAQVFVRIVDKIVAHSRSLKQTGEQF